MPCAATHRIVNFTATAAYLASRPKKQQNGIAHPLVGATATTVLASLPDAIEPAIHPHHRQFFTASRLRARSAMASIRRITGKPKRPNKNG